VAIIFEFLTEEKETLSVIIVKIDVLVVVSNSAVVEVCISMVASLVAETLVCGELIAIGG
jgi:hypothetical protein